ncbi:hypothetical protein QUF90_12020 [Desulfococcaceae bacterium HSG9]|nr:hypothetical protein [Desulfococcaceae bacterium HSG9]
MERFDLSEIAPLPVTCFFQTNDLISCDIVFRPVIGMPRRQPEDKGERDSHVAGDRRHEDIIVSHNVAFFGVVIKFMNKFHMLTEFFDFSVVENNPDPSAALRRRIGKAELPEKIEKQRHSRHTERFF